MERIWFNIFKPIADSHNLKPEQVEEIFNSQFQYIRYEVSQIDILQNKLPTIAVPNLGKFYEGSIKARNWRKKHNIDNIPPSIVSYKKENPHRDENKA